MVGLLHTYLNRGDLLHDLEELTRLLSKATGCDGREPEVSAQLRPASGNDGLLIGWTMPKYGRSARPSKLVLRAGSSPGSTRSTFAASADCCGSGERSEMWSERQPRPRRPVFDFTNRGSQTWGAVLVWRRRCPSAWVYLHVSWDGVRYEVGNKGQRATILSRVVY